MQRMSRGAQTGRLSSEVKVGELWALLRTLNGVMKVGSGYVNQAMVLGSEYGKSDTPVSYFCAFHQS